MAERSVIYVHSGDWPSPSPSVVFATGTVSGLARRVPTVLVVKNNAGESTNAVYRSIAGEDPPPDLRVVRVGKGRPPGHAAFFRKAAGIVGEYAASGMARAVITRSIGFLPYLWYCRERWRVPCYFESHDFFTDPGQRPDLPRNLRTAKNRWYERTFIPRLEGLICLTEAQKSLYEAWYPDVQITVARTGLFRAARPDTVRERKVCYIGSLDPHKGLGTVLEALARMGDRELSLVVVGGKSERETQSFMELARLMEVGDRVQVTGWVPHADVSHYMDRCIAGVVPLRDTPFNRCITSPLKILDCFSRALPVIASDLPTVREYVRDGVHGLLFPPGDSDRLAAALDRFSTGGLFDACSRAVASDAPSYLWERRADSILAFLGETGA